MFEDKIKVAAIKYFKASREEKASLRSVFLKDPAKSTALILIFGVITLRDFCKAKLTTPYRQAPDYLYREIMSLSKKVTEDITEFVVSVGEISILEICHYLTTHEASTAIQACFVLLNINQLSDEALAKVDYALHHLSGRLGENARMHVAILITCIQAQNNYGNALYMIEREAQKKGMTWREATHNFIGSAYDFLLVPSYDLPDLRKMNKVDESQNDSSDLAAMAYNYYTYWDPDNAPWNYE